MAIKVRPKKSTKKSTEKGTGIPLRMPANTVREDYGKGNLNVQQIIRGETPSDVKLREGKIRLIETEKIKPVEFQKNKKTKKYGGKITYKMSGGQVVDSSYD